MGYAKLDTHREVRSGFPEVIFCSGKADLHLLSIYERLYENEGEVLGTRASTKQYELIRDRFPQAVYDPVSRILKISREDKELTGNAAVCTAGTADIPVAEEAAQTAEFFGTKVERIYDVILGVIVTFGIPEAVIAGILTTAIVKILFRIRG